MKNHLNEPLGMTGPRPHKPKTFWSEVDAAKHRKTKVFLIKVLSCILIALLFLIAVFDSGFGKVIAWLGVVVTCSVAAVLVDRHLGR